MNQKNVSSTMAPIIVVSGLVVVLVAGFGGILSNCPSVYLSCAHSPLILIFEIGLVLILFGTLGLVYYKHLLYIKKLKKNGY